MADDTLALNPVYPHDPSVGLYSRAMPVFAHPHAFTGWQDESLSWKRTAYLSANLNPCMAAEIHGPDAVKFLSDVTPHSFANFPVGRCKHTVLTDDGGLIWTHGLALRVGEEEVHTYFLTPWLDYRAQQGSWDIRIEDRMMDRFVFQLAGPRCLEVLEVAAGEDLHDLAFMAHRPSQIAGADVRVLRMGMGGTLSYEVHGNVEDAQQVYSALHNAGTPFGLRRLGWHTYATNHTENGYQQMDYHFMTASVREQGFLDFLQGLGFDTDVWPNGALLLGSSGTDRDKRLRNPFQVGFDKSVTFDHEFPGRPALEREVAKPTKRTVTLVWNPEDLRDVFDSYFQREEEPYKFLAFPIEDMFETPGGALHQDDVLDADGNLVGYSSGREYSLHSRDMFSLGVIDVGHIDLGTELVLVWGDAGTRQKRVRVTVSRFPHLDLPPNHLYDVDSIPRLAR